MADRQIIRDLIKKYAPDPYVKINWQTWGNYPARLDVGYVFEFEGEFIDHLTSVEAKFLALHEIAHYLAMNAHHNVQHAEHDSPIFSLSVYSLMQREKIGYTAANLAQASIHRKWAAYYGRR
jgi:hypothetical protein